MQILQIPTGFSPSTTDFNARKHVISRIFFFSNFNTQQLLKESARLKDIFPPGLRDKKEKGEEEKKDMQTFNRIFPVKRATKSMFNQRLLTYR